MKTINLASFCVLLAFCLQACTGNRKEEALTPFDRYPPSQYYFDYLCVDSFISESGNPVFVYETYEDYGEDDSMRVRMFVEPDDSMVLIDGYYAPEWRITPEDLKRYKVGSIYS